MRWWTMEPINNVHKLFYSHFQYSLVVNYGRVDVQQSMGINSPTPQESNI